MEQALLNVREGKKERTYDIQVVPEFMEQVTTEERSSMTTKVMSSL
jgi:hypothetical protein